MSYFTETFNLILEMESNDIIDAGKAIGTGAVTAVLTGNPIAGAKAGMKEMKYPYDITYAGEDGNVYHGKIAYTKAKDDYIKKKEKNKKLGVKEKMDLSNKVEARLNMAIAYERYDLNKVLNMYPAGYIKD